MPNKIKPHQWILLSLCGLVLFAVLYIIATLVYPRGSYPYRSAKGFSWLHNYWCELMAADAQNGAINTARPLAITAMFILAISLVIFWIIVPSFLDFKRVGKKVIQYSGTLSMAILPVLFTGAHDVVLNIAGFFGVIAIAGLLTGLYSLRLNFVFMLGIVCLVLVGVNNYIYYTTHLYYYLPVIQKITFLVFLLWFFLIGMFVYKKSKITGKLIG